ncbi:MAG: hypothetical protein H7263_03135 [Candidatus Sericytochromatia bacterium]|nr:hypothetical protein [Candidatus Sericytochromatia bacterium]
MSLKALTLRIEQSLYDEVKSFAQRENSSVNSFFEKIIREKIRKEEDKLLFDEFSIVGQDQEDSDVEYSLLAQKEVIYNEKS